MHVTKSLRAKRCLFAAVLLLAASHHSRAWRGTAHLVSVPFIEGAGIYTSVSLLRTNAAVPTKATAVTSLSLLAMQGTLGSLLLFGSPELQQKVAPIHRYVGFAVAAAGAAMSIAATTDDETRRSPAMYTSYGYSALTVFPIVAFTF